MREALAEAKKVAGRTSPNPAVGAVLVQKGRVVARGAHLGPGSPHAEIVCIRKRQGRIAPDMTLYVTLEPCSTSGRTGPCTEAITSAGIRNVVVGAIDPNPRHAGRGIGLLKSSGLQVRTGVLSTEITALNRAFNKWIVTRQPWVIAKCGMSLDGRLTAPVGERWITSPASRRHANRLRATVDAIVVGAETVRRDDPHLTVRAMKTHRQPWRVVLTRSGQLPRNARIFTDAHADRTLVFRQRKLREVLEELGAREITSVLLEGGGEVLSEALDEHLIDRVQIYIGARFTGGPTLAFGGRGAAAGSDALRMENVRYEQIGDDVLLTADAVTDIFPSRSE